MENDKPNTDDIKISCHSLIIVTISVVNLRTRKPGGFFSLEIASITINVGPHKIMHFNYFSLCPHATHEM